MAATVIKTLDDIVNRDNRYDINNISFYQLSGDGRLVIQMTTMFDIYYRYIMPYVGEYSVSKEQKKYYRCKPHLLSSDIYGVPDLVWMLLKLNNRECPSRFYLKDTVRLIPANQLERVYDTIVTKAGDRMAANHNKYLRMVGKEVEES